MITYIYFFISHDNSKAFKYVLSLIRQFNCEIIRTNQKGNARPLKADIRTPACRDPLPLSAGPAGGGDKGRKRSGCSSARKEVHPLPDAPGGFRFQLTPAAVASPPMRQEVHLKRRSYSGVWKGKRGTRTRDCTKWRSLQD